MNWQFYNADNVSGFLGTLEEVLNTDKEHVIKHTTILHCARTWDQSARKNKVLLTGDDLEVRKINTN